MSNSPRINRALAELEFDLWEALVLGELEVNTDLKLNFAVKRVEVGRVSEESVEVTIAIRKRDASD